MNFVDYKQAPMMASYEKSMPDISKLGNTKTVNYTDKNATNDKNL